MKIINLLPKILSLAFAAFLFLFSLDIFSAYKGIDAVLPFAIHSIPAFLMLASAIVAWKYDLVGAVAFFCFAVFYIVLVGFGRPWSWYAVISLPTAIIGVLFFLNWLEKKKR